MKITIKQKIPVEIKNIFLILFFLVPINSHAQDIISHDFNDGRVSPYNVCTTQSPNYAKVVSQRLKTFWQESSYNGTRMTKGAEVCADWHTTKEGWYGMTMNIGSDYPRDKKGGVAQIFQFVSSSFWSWAAMLQMDNGDLTIIHRSNGGSSSNIEEVVVRDFPTEKNVNIIMHFILSKSNNGELQIWVDGVSRYHKQNINFGYGTWNGDVQDGEYTYVDLKAGQYNFESDDYRSGETRTVYYDNLSWYAGSNGYSIVDPSSSSTPPLGGFVSMKKANNSAFAIDGNSGGANGQNVYLWGVNSGNQNQHWEELSRGNNYFSYKKRGTNFCLDGGNGGANGQTIYLWSCTDNNHNQHWKKVNVGNNFRLEKRNAPKFSIDGNNGGRNGQDLYLWESSDSNANQQWIFSNH